MAGVLRLCDRVRATEVGIVYTCTTLVGLLLPEWRCADKLRLEMDHMNVLCMGPRV